MIESSENQVGKVINLPGNKKIRLFVGKKREISFNRCYIIHDFILQHNKYKDLADYVPYSYLRRTA